MRVQNQPETSVNTLENAWEVLSSEGPTIRSYHEMADRPVIELDVMTQLESNLVLLENLQGRLSFIMREMREIIKA